MRRTSTLLAALCLAMTMFAQGWKANYGGVMLQGFYWDSYQDTKWTNLEAQAKELSDYFDLVWLPQSAQARNNPQWATTTTIGSAITTVRSAQRLNS